MKKTLLFSFCFLLIGITHAQITTLHHPRMIPVKLQRITPQLRSLPDRDPMAGRHEVRDNFSLEHPMQVTDPNALPLGDDPALQKVYGQRSIQDAQAKVDTVIGNVNILGTYEGLSTNVDPSDNNIAVGLNEVVQLVNGNGSSSEMRVWDKSGNILASSKDVKDLTGISDFGDPSIIYDEAADRYAFVLLALSGSKLIFAVSASGDPLGSYYAYSFKAEGGFPDYPKLAVWGNSYFITTNSNSPSVFALNRDSLIAGVPFSFAQKFSMQSFPTLGFQSASPVNFTGSILPPANDPELIMRVADDAWDSGPDTDRLELFETSINWQDTTLSSITGPINLNTISYNSDMCGFNTLSCIPQPGTNTKLDPLSNILMDKIKYRGFADHESIVCTHVVNKGDGKAGIRWYELRRDPYTTWHIYQQGTFAPQDTNYRWMSSITINDDGTIALGYNISSKLTYPGVRFTGRVSCDSLGLMTIPETIAKDGIASNNINRYGDYNGIVTDPVDGSFWLTGQYNPSGSWSTSVTHFTIASCYPTVVPPSVAAAAEHFQLMPNPASNQMAITYESAGDDRATFSLVDISGRIVFQKRFELHKGTNNVFLDIKQVEDGFYIAQLKTAGTVMVNDVVVAR